MPEEQIRVSSKNRSIIIEILKFSILALLIVTPFRFFVAQPFIVSGASMIPTFHPSEYLVIDQLSYRFEDPERGDIVILRYPYDPSMFFIKRVIGLPGESIHIEDGEVRIRHEDSSDTLTLQEPYLPSAESRSESFRITLADDEYFVLGDNRRASSDSRTWGPLRKELITGRVFMRLFPVGEAQMFPGKYQFSEL